MVDTRHRQSSASRKRTLILKELRGRLARLPDEQLEAVTDPAAIGERMIQMVPPAPGEFSRLIGPVYSTKALEAMWGVGRAAVSKRAKEGRLFSLKVGGANVFPLFQFDGSEVRPHLLKVVRTLAEADVDAWTIAAWLCTPLASDLDGRTPVELLDVGEHQVVQAAAAEHAQRWAA